VLAGESIKKFIGVVGLILGILSVPVIGTSLASSRACETTRMYGRSLGFEGLLGSQSDHVGWW
jgi:hypothetical protein